MRSSVARRWMWSGLALIGAAMGSHAVADEVRTEHVSVELVAERTSVAPGQTVNIGLRLQHQPHWHTYWRNPGDAGLPTRLAWTLPQGAQVGDIAWPAPQRLPVGPLMNYGYEGEVLLPVPFTAPATAFAGSTLTVRAQASWLVCKDVCIPENASLELRLPVVATGTEPGSSFHTALFAKAEAEGPAPIGEWKVDAQRAGRDVLLTFAAPSGSAGPSSAGRPAVQVFPYAEQVFEPVVQELYAAPSGYAVKLRLAEGAEIGTALDGIVVAPVVGGPAAAPNGALESTSSTSLPRESSSASVAGDTPPSLWGTDRRSAEFDAPVATVAALVLPEGAKRVATASADAATPANDPWMSSSAMPGADIGAVMALLLAFAGGLVLNFMPCVFPMISIKLLSLSKQDCQAADRRAHAFGYAGGVVFTFLALAGVLLVLRAAGSAVGWGFQMQQPGVVFALAVLFFVFGLNLLGGFELAQFMPQRLAAWRGRKQGVDAFAGGVLAVVAATPCTAPFMGAALGYALTQSAGWALAVFAMLGLGMATPFTLLVLQPRWRNWLPKPGAWMLRLKQALAFPMFATAVWLVWVLGLQTGIDGAARALLGWVGIGFVLWLFCLPTLRRGWIRAVGAAAMAGVLALAWPGSGTADTAALGSTAGAYPTLLAAAKSGIEGGEADPRWKPFDDAALSILVAGGKPVFIDFTAAWCVSCQVNKRLVLNGRDTLDAFAAADVTLMRADWTQRDDRITAALARFGRNGVPVYALMRPGKSTLLLSEILTRRELREALATL
ncbi:MAG: putative ThiO:disulfide interchange protein [Rhizobacter sp.]|nr:putative ThiO:disulfide interchange protein [Rhizobacter sp.]